MFTHLHVHTQFSLLDGSCKIRELVRRAKDMGMDSLAITDHGVMYGCVDFYKACKEEGIRPILGCEIYMAPGSRFEKSAGKGEERYYHLILLAENYKGYENLMKIVSLGFLEGYYYKPRVDREILEKYHEGLICLSACLAGEIPRAIVAGQDNKAKETALYFKNLFGKDHFYLELQDHGIPAERLVNHKLIAMSKELEIPLVATNDSHYILPEDWEAHDVLLCIQTGKKLADQDRMRYRGGQYYLKSEEEMRELFSYVPEALDHTYEIASRCQVDLEFGVTKLPPFPVPEGYDALSYLTKLCRDGLKERYDHPSQEMKDRLNYELSTIQSMGYVEYFLIVWDFIHYAKSRGIPVGPGRGSAAGSIVAYTLGITDIDPIRYQLLFERFLNPERVSMPDIDVDFCYVRRQEVIDYVVGKYGKDNVAQIVTFGTLGAKEVIRDVARVMDLPYETADRVAKMIPGGVHVTIDAALKENREFSNLYDQDPTIHDLIDTCKKLEGLPRHTSMHAAGVVICGRPVSDYVPLSKNQDGVVTTQYIMTTLEELGLLKMDFLGLRTLTVIKDAVELVKKNHGISLNMDRIDYDDPKVFDSLATGRTEGIFQLESPGMMRFMKELAPKKLEDIIAGISLYRPGPMDFIPKYLKGKNHPESVSYDTPELEPILEPTYGCIVYQEQVMQIVQSLAGFSLGRSDLLRRAMSKKKIEVMEKERQAFVYGDQQAGVEGCIKRGISLEVANKIYDEMIDFAKYAFNKSHAACYAVVSYRTAYLKYYYPKEFMAALLSSVIENPGKVTSYIQLCKDLKISILPPDINLGEDRFIATREGIVYSLSAIKNVGGKLVGEIVREREENGPYKTLQDFIDRGMRFELNKRAVENLIKAGAFDHFYGNRKQKMLVYQTMMDHANNEKKHSSRGQMSLVDFLSPEEKKTFEVQYPEIEDYDREERLLLEKEVAGFYISGHPLDTHRDLLDKNTSKTSLDFILDAESFELHVKDKEPVAIGGVITEVTTRMTRKGEPMAILTLEDLYGSIQVLAFPRCYAKYSRLLVADSKVLITGRASVEDNSSKVFATDVYDFSEVPKTLWLQYENRDIYDEKHARVEKILKDHPGKNPVKIFLKKERKQKNMGNEFNVSEDQHLFMELESVLGEENIRVTATRIIKSI